MAYEYIHSVKSASLKVIHAVPKLLDYFEKVSI